MINRYGFFQKKFSLLLLIQIPEIITDPTIIRLSTHTNILSRDIFLFRTSRAQKKVNFDYSHSLLA